MRKDWLMLTLAPLLLVSCSCSQRESPPAAATGVHPVDTASAATQGIPALAAASPAIAPVAAGNVPAAKPDQILRITLRDTRTHAPVYHAGLILADARNLDWTDRDGVHEWSGGGFPSRGSIAIRCPALRAEVGRKIKVVAYAMDGKRTDLVAQIDASACIEPAEKTTTGAYAGTYYPYYGHGAFIPCTGMPADAAFYGNTKAAWVNLGNDAMGAFGKARAAAGADPASQDRLYVEWSGTLTGPGGFGTQTAFAYRLDVTAVAKVDKAFPEGCPAAPLQ